MLNRIFLIVLDSVGVGDAPGGHLPPERAGNGVLTHDFREGLRPPRAVQCLITHE